jgi:hypothetical protein
MQVLKTTTALVASLLIGATSWAQFPCELSGGEGEPANGGPSAIQSGQYHDNSNYHLKFEVFEPCVLNSVRVFANGADQRSIALLSPGGDILQAEVFDIPDGESVVELGWTLSPGAGFGLASLSNNPQLWRDDLDATLAYPYAIGDYASITGSSVNGENEFNYYYFFYDWNIGPAEAVVNSGGYPCHHVELMRWGVVRTGMIAGDGWSRHLAAKSHFMVGLAACRSSMSPTRPTSSTLPTCPRRPRPACGGT